MKKIWLCSLLPLIVVALVSPGWAEFYRYKDQHGNTIYTDDLSKVPEAQRDQATMYEESRARSAYSVVQKEQKAEMTAEQQATELEDLKKEGQRLRAVKEKLDQEYNELANENSKLRTEQNQAATPDQIKEVNKKVVSFNTRFQAYQEKSAAYESEVKVYNERLSAVESKPQPDGSGEKQ